jgi:hypothetical protein
MLRAFRLSSPSRYRAGACHHLGGRRWTIVLDLTPNWHRILSALQRMRKGVTTGNTAELLYGIGDLIYAIADYVNACEQGTAE